ncbi:DnaB-like helicase N-terminal domain-containing protein [Evansella sp. AB-rgal1]|uniref:DnaB-like helicase N-terminal domain-containing protein n=1 Tax=Evansella sp. AB-rgal1 TaxID=3242696 RepID=UPI00359D1A3B
MGLQGNMEAEKLLLGCILMNNSVMKELVIQPEHFSILHRDLFRAMIEISVRGEMINRATLFEKLGSNYMSQLNIGEMMEAVPSASGFTFHEELVLRYWKNIFCRKQEMWFRMRR